jgi:tetratricopeptide (TPR) repeat protein
MRLAMVIAGALALLVCAAALADEIKLKNGDKINGRILEEAEDSVVIETPYGKLRIPRDRIESVTKDEAKPTEKPQEPQKPQEPEVKKGSTVVIHLKNGDKIEGELLEEAEDAVRVQTSFGPLRIPRDQIEKISGGAAAGADVAQKKRQLADKHYELAMWAKEKGLEDEVKANLEAAIELCPDHEKARAALGYVKKEGQWVKGEKPAEPQKPAQEKMTVEQLLEAHQLAQTHLQAKEHDKALAVYGEILKSYPDDLTGNYNTVCILSLQKKVEEALKRLEHAVVKSREAMDTGSFEKKQEAEQILGLLDNDTDLDNLRDSEKFKAILKLAKGEEDEGEKKEPEKKPDDKKKSGDF